MYEKFTDRSRKVMQLANQEAQRFNHEYIGTEHILLGLIKEGSGVAASVIKNLGLDLRKIRLEVEKLVAVGPAGDLIIMGKLPHTPRAKTSLNFAIQEAAALQHRYVGTEHLLLGLIREEDGVASKVLSALGASTEKVRNEIIHLLGHNPQPQVQQIPDGTIVSVDVAAFYELGQALFIRGSHPRVIWMGSEPLRKEGKFRLVDRGPARAGRPDDVPFGLERQIGVNFLKQKVWMPVNEAAGNPLLAIHALTHALGQVLTVDLKKLNLDHPLACELNMAIVEGRDPKGCDCHAPPDPLSGKPPDS